MASTLWGLSGLFYDLMPHVPAPEIMAHRTVWGFVFFALYLWNKGRLRAPFEALAKPRALRVISAAAVMVGTNWLGFVYAVQTDRALEASVGYFIFPLLSVLFGRLFYAERLDHAQTLAVALAAGGVLVLTVGLGVTPWIALLLGISFGLYGLIKKGLNLGPVVSVTAESMLLLPFASLAIVWIHMQGQGHFGATGFDTVLLMLSGPMTAVPLMLFSYSALRISMASVGVISYLNPSLQVVVAALIMAEPFGLWHGMSFGLIWTALVIYTTASWRQDRAARRIPVNSLTDPVTRR
jgi:chloramphenicol-sensitive protein RarD